MHGNIEPFRADSISASPPAIDAQELWTPRNLISILTRRWRAMLATTLLAVGLVGVWLVQLTPVYTATTQVLIDPRKERVLTSESIVSDIGLDLSAISTEVSLIQSFSIARRVVEKLQLDQLPDYGRPSNNFSLIGSLRSLISGAGQEDAPPADPEAPPGAASPEVLAAVARVQKDLSVRRLAQTYVLELSCQSTNPQLAARLAAAIADAYLDEQLEARFQASKRAAEWLSDRVAVLRKQLETSERALNEHRTKYNLVNPAGGTISEQQAAEVNTQLVAARAQTVEKKAKYDQAQKILEGGVGIETVAAVMDSPIITALWQQENQIARDEANQLSNYGPEHPSIVKIRATRADIKRQITREVSRLVQTLKTDVQFALEKEQSLLSSLAELSDKGGQNGQAIIRLRELERDAQSNRTLYETTLTRFKEAEQQTSLNTAESRVIAPALIPKSPSFPQTSRFLMMAAVLGLLLGTGVAVLLDRIESGFTTMEQLEQLLQLPVLAMIPALADKDRIVDGKPLPIPDYVAAKPLSQFGESIRSARVSTQMSDIDQPPRLVLVTSSVPSEGKSTVALSFAYSAAASNQRVLLMDCDLRHPSTSKHFNLHEAKGLTDLLLGDAPPEVTFVRGPLRTLTILPAGTTTRHPPDVLGSERLRQLLESVRQSYDLVVIDAPPITPVIDGTILAKLVDKVVFVVQWRSTPREIVQRALQTLDTPRQRIAGIVFNNAQLDRMASYSPYYSYYHKRYQKYYTE
jgi:polysaccharide biosynthesis transport protein